MLSQESEHESAPVGNKGKPCQRNGKGESSSEKRERRTILCGDREQWGRFDPATEAIEVHETAAPGDDDLLERAATQTVLHGGSVYVLEAPMVPGGQFAAAVFRY